MAEPTFIIDNNGSKDSPGGGNGIGYDVINRGPAPPTANGPETMVDSGYVFQKVKNPYALPGSADEYEWVKVGAAPKGLGGDSGSGGSSSSQSTGESQGHSQSNQNSQGWSGTYHNDALDAAQSVMSAMLQSQTLADARRFAAADQFQKMAQYALPKGMMPPGYEAGGAAQQLAALQGRPTYAPPPITTQAVNPAMLANTTPQAQMFTLKLMNDLIDAANKGIVSKTGESTSIGSSVSDQSSHQQSSSGSSG